MLLGTARRNECVRQRVPGVGCEVQDAGYRIQDTGYREPDVGCRTPDVGCRCRIQDAGNGLGGDGQSVTLK
jgi:hypothetical protein